MQAATLGKSIAHATPADIRRRDWMERLGCFVVVLGSST
jgi:hypothetical protein